MTDDIDPRIDPTKLDYPPRIDEQSVDPPNNMPVVIKPLGTTTSQDWCRRRLIIFKVTDEDVWEDLVAKWFVDQRLATAPIIISAQGLADRFGPSFVFDAGAVAENSESPGLHVVKVLISDGFVNTENDSTAVKSGMGVVSYSWTIDTRNAAECPGPATPSPGGGAQ